MIFVIFCLGLIFGSFINALVFRMHEKNNKKYKKIDLSIFTGRSICPNCKHVLAPIDLIPVFSWIYLRGKCRYCKAKISVQYPLVELTTAILFLFSYILWPYGFTVIGACELFVWLVIVLGFISLSIYDLKWLILPNKAVLMLTIVGILNLLIFTIIFNHHYTGALLAILSGLIIFGFFWILFIISNGRWIGGGDVKIGFLLGLLAGTPIKSFLVIFLASLLGTLFFSPSLILSKRKIKSQIPFGPFLILASYIVFLCGSRIIDWYNTIIL